MASNNGTSVWSILGAIVVGYLLLRILPNLINPTATAAANGQTLFGLTTGPKGTSATVTGNANSLLASLISALKTNKTPSTPLPTMVPSGGSTAPGGTSSLISAGNSLGAELLAMVGGANQQTLGDASLYFNGSAGDNSIAGLSLPSDPTQLFDTSQLAYSNPSSSFSDSTVDPSSGLDLSAFNGNFDPSSFGSSATSMDGGGWGF